MDHTRQYQETKLKKKKNPKFYRICAIWQYIKNFQIIAPKEEENFLFLVKNPLGESSQVTCPRSPCCLDKAPPGIPGLTG